MMVLAGSIEIAHDVCRRPSRLLVATVRSEMDKQPVEGIDLVLDALVTGVQHLDGMIEVGRNRRPNLRLHQTVLTIRVTQRPHKA